MKSQKKRTAFNRLSDVRGKGKSFLRTYGEKKREFSESKRKKEYFPRTEGGGGKKKKREKRGAPSYFTGLEGGANERTEGERFWGYLLCGEKEKRKKKRTCSHLLP